MIYFIRHGQSTANAGGMTMEHARIPLSDLGRAQAATLAQLLEVDPVLVLTSSYLRARETAQPFCDKTGCVATPHPLLHEFSALDPALIEGMSGAERRPIADAYWQEADPAARHGPGSETFVEFDERVTAFRGELPGLPSDTVLFGHGIWFGLLCWKLLGFSAEGSAGMTAFRRFQRGLPMPNCAVYTVEQLSPGKWHLQGEEAIARKIEAVNCPGKLALG